MALRLNRAEVDMTPATFEWEEDADVKIVGVPLTPKMRRDAMRKAGVKASEVGISVVEATFDLSVEYAVASFRSWEGIERPDNGKPAGCDRRWIEHMVGMGDDGPMPAAISFFQDLYSERAGERQEAEGN